ncbi:MAG: proton-conducting transporter membrane subunit, partial [Acidimicrobiales bacterium]
TADVTADVTADCAPLAPPKGEVSRWIVVAMVIGLLALVVLGVHPPASLEHLLSHAAHELGAPR